MPKRIYALIKPIMLVWARETAGYDKDTAAKKIGISKEKLEEWESGKSRPTIAQLKKIANIYKRPLAVFYLPEPPKDFEVAKDFRRLPYGSDYRSPELRYAIRKACQRREIAIDLADSNQIIEPITGICRITEGEGEVAAKVRNLLGITTEDQYSWKNAYQALNAWKSAIERYEILVFQEAGISIREMRGVSISEKRFPVIMINGKDSPTGRIFTLIHELIHILIGAGGICDEGEEHDNHEKKEIEDFCNRVAAEILVPTAALEEKIAKEDRTKKVWEDQEIKVLANKFNVSHEVILIRLVTIGRCDEDYYWKRHSEILKRRRNTEDDRPLSKGGGPQYHIKKTVELGTLFIRTVLEAYYRNQIPFSHVGDYLDVKLKHLRKIEEWIYR